MDDRELERILEEIGREEFVPPAALVEATKRRFRRSAILPMVVFLSMCMNLLLLILVLYGLCLPAIPLALKVYGVCGLGTVSGALILTIVGARREIASFFQQLEWMIH